MALSITISWRKKSSFLSFLFLTLFSAVIVYFFRVYGGTYFTFLCLLFGTVKYTRENWDEDAELVRQVKQGNRNAYCDLFNKYHDAIYRYCYMILSRQNDPSEDAKDATQEVFVKCLANIYDLKKDSAYFSWLRKTAFNTCMNMVKQTSPDPIPDGFPAPEAGPDSRASNSEIQMIIKKALNTLDEKYRLAIIHVHLMGHSYMEAAETMKCKEGDIRRWVHRGLMKLRDGLKEYRGLID
jgi:RNA polymerase sigma-70 factor (ECF subfamily)